MAPQRLTSELVDTAVADLKPSEICSEYCKLRTMSKRVSALFGGIRSVNP